MSRKKSKFYVINFIDPRITFLKIQLQHRVQWKRIFRYRIKEGCPEKGTLEIRPPENCPPPTGKLPAEKCPQENCSLKNSFTKFFAIFLLNFWHYWQLFIFKLVIVTSFRSVSRTPALSIIDLLVIVVNGVI